MKVPSASPRPSSVHVHAFAAAGSTTIVAVVAALVAAVPAVVTAGETPPPHPPVELAAADVPVSPGSGWTLDTEASVLWKITDSTPLDYSVLVTAVSLRTPEHFRFDAGDGHLVLRGNFTLLAEAFLRGPETGYLGFSASPSIEYVLPNERTRLYFSAGGGLGWVDSTDVPGGQGQDLTLNWFIKTGIRHHLGGNWSLSAGLLFQHLSNRGMSDRNPGLDALGPSLGVSWSF